MAYFDINGPDFNKPRYSSDVLIYNWYEERALKDPNFLGYAPRATKIDDSEVEKEAARLKVEEEKKAAEAAAAAEAQRHAAARNRQNGQPDYPISLTDPLRGYYATTYKRAYGPREGYIGLNTYPTVDARRYAIPTPGGEQGTGTSGGEGCLRCEQLSKSRKESSECLRCAQLAGL